MKISKNTEVYLRVILLFSIAIAMSFLADSFHSFFGDVVCDGTAINAETGEKIHYTHYGLTHYEIKIHWGARRWLFFLMGITLGTFQIISIIKLYNKEKS